MSSLTGAVASRGSIDDLRQRMETLGTPATVAAGAGANAGEIETTRVDRLLREREADAKDSIADESERER